MKVVALVSGGKDSCYAMMKCIRYGHEIVAVANLLPDDESVDELDSYMYQTVGHQIVVSYAECMGVPLFRRKIQGSSRHLNCSYKTTPGDEVEDMFVLLSEVKKQIPSVTAVSSGAIASDYQRLRVENICSRLGLVSLAYLWKQDQSLLLHEMITSGIQAIIVKVAAIGLDPAKHLGKDISFMEPYLHKLNELYGINVCGEGGEYETLTLDCPLFNNARIVLEDFKIVLHSSGCIAPVGILHPSKFHLENKENPQASISREKTSVVIDVEGDSRQNSEAVCQPVPAGNGLADSTTNKRLHISKTKKASTFSICCWLQDECESSAGIQEDLTTVLTEIESQFLKHGFNWEHVLYIHLYISNMNEFAAANETYVKFITQERCPFGVPSRSTIELPLVQQGLGKAYVEVLVANDKSKRVLHVQSISSWAPSCIGPYSQATLHKEILHMAGQLGLDPPTMTLCNGGSTAELEQALENSEAIAKSFNCSISTSALLFVIFCSIRTTSSQRLELHDKFLIFLEKTRRGLDERSTRKVLEPVFLYVLVPDLPKSALVEVKPVLYVAEDREAEKSPVHDKSFPVEPSYLSFQHESWHDSCIQKCVADDKICVVVLSITAQVAAKIFSCHIDSAKEGRMGKLSKFCLYLLDKVLLESNFSWEDTMSLRLHFTTNLDTTVRQLSDSFTTSFTELAKIGRSINIEEAPIFNIVPVTSIGISASSLDNVITCELLARKS